MKDDSAIDHRAIARFAHHRAWDLLEKPDRSAAETEEMIHVAHASLWHWLHAGTGVHHQRGVWMIARVCADAALLEPARRYLARTEELTAQHRAVLADFDFAFVAALAARIAALAGDRETALRQYGEAVRLGEGLTDAEDRKEFFRQLDAGPWYGFTPQPAR